jgi:HK97 family phage major capsid protein
VSNPNTDNPNKDDHPTDDLDAVVDRLKSGVADQIKVVAEESKAATAELAAVKAEVEGYRAEMAAMEQAAKSKAGLPGWENVDTDGRQRFSLMRACWGHVNKWSEQSGTKSFPEYEAVHDYSNHLRSMEAVQEKTGGAQVGVGDSGGLLVSSTMMPDMAQELEARVIAQAMGVESFTGLVGDLTINREDGGIVAYRKGEGLPITESSAQYSSLELRPLELTARTRASKKLLMQTSGRIQSLLERQLARKIALKMDLDFFKGGGGNTPVGIINAEAPASATTPFSGTPNPGDVSNWQEFSDLLETMVGALKARDAYYGYGEVKWAAHPSTFSFLRKVKNNDAVPMLFDAKMGDMQDGVSQADKLYGHRYAESTQLEAGTTADLLLFPVLSSFIAMWDTLTLFPSEHADGAFENNELAIRAVTYNDSGIYRGDHLQRASLFDVTA